MEHEQCGNEKKPHRERKAGRKAEKKKKKNVIEESAKQKNPKAFTFNSAIRAERRFRRKQDINTKKQHVPLVDRTPLEPPPILIAIVGPPKVGKTTLMNNLIKLFSKSPLTDIKGPVTLVTGKKRRITLIECNNDINSMIDLAKVCDLALLLSNASFGFEMEIFEFLNICQVHGMPKIMGVLTHLDQIKNNKALRTTKKTLKHRFWTEVYPGAKLFYLSGIIRGDYLNTEIKNLGRFISVMKFRPLTWRQNHSYILADRYEDLTSQELIRNNPKCDRNICLYGYVRGAPLKKQNSIHIAGFGDIKIDDVSYLPDPCPLPEQIKKRVLIEKERLIYAPFSGVGGIVYDKDAVYIESHQKQKRNNDPNDDDDDDVDSDNDKNLVMNLIDTKATLDEKVKHSEIQLFTDGITLAENDIDNVIPIENNSNMAKCKIVDESNSELKGETHNDDTDVVTENEDENSTTENESEDSDNDHSQNVKLNSNINANIESKLNENVHMKISNVLTQLEKKNLNLDENSDDEDDENDDSDSSETESDEEIADGDDYNNDEVAEDMAIKWKNDLTEKAHNAFLNRISNNQNLMKLVYGGVNSKKNNENKKFEDEQEAVEELGGILIKKVENQQKLQRDREIMDLCDSSLMFSWNTTTKDWTNEENKSQIANCFVTGKWKDSEDANELLKLDDTEIQSDTSEIFGDFEDLETGEKHAMDTEKTLKRKHDDNDLELSTNEREQLAEKKRKLKEKFDAEYDHPEENSYYDGLKLAAEKQADLNKAMFENMPDDVRVEIEGFRSGMYVRLEFKDVPAEFIINFDATYPLVLGSLNLAEENIGYVNVRIKKHRWYNKILKTNDPLIISLGWRRFQTMPLYSKLEDDLKHRYLKYTPEHLACNAHFWGPITPQGIGFLALQRIDSNPETLKKGFRIAATGTVLELSKSTQIMKKLKLIGHPYKIYKKTAFIKDMFNSALEVQHFTGARIKTVSGIRGQIKKGLSKPEGCFRATFEDKILLSDIVFCRTWYKVDVQQFYNPVITLLLPPELKNQWRGAKTTGEVKRENNIRNEKNDDNLYTPVIREEKPFKPLVIPAKLQKALPYRDKPNHGIKSNEKKTQIDRVAVVRDPQEQKISTMIKMIKTTYKQKQEKLKEETKQRLEQHRQEILNQENRKLKKIQQQKKQFMKRKSQLNVNK